MDISCKDEVITISNFKYYKRLWKYIIKKQFWAFIGYILLMIFLSSLTPLYVYIWNMYIDEVSIDQRFDRGVLVLGCFVLVRIMVDFGMFFSRHMMDVINSSSWRLLDGEINKKAVSIKNEYYETSKVQVMIDRAWNFSHGAYVELYQITLDIIRLVTQIIGVFYALIIIDYGLGFIMILTLIISAKISMLIEKNRIKCDKFSIEELREVNYYKNLKYDLQKIKDLMCFDLFDFFDKKYSRAHGTYLKKSLEYEKKDFSYEIIKELIQNIIIASGIVYVVIRAGYGGISIGGLAVTIGLLMNSIVSMEQLSSDLVRVYANTTDIAYYFEFIDFDEGIMEKDFGNNDIDEDSIILDNVSYKYQYSEGYAIKNVQLNIKKGTKVAIVGLNGSGKTTLIKIIAGLLEPSNGKISVFGIGAKRLEKKLFTSVFQDFCRYKESLEYNVKISDTEKNDDNRMNKALKKSGFSKDIGKEELLAKEFGGVDLSGGEWQKLAIARALYRDSDVMIFDEPTSAIDALSESKMYKQLQLLSKGKTCFFVTHRLGSVLFSDLILYMENGEIIEKGSHEELIRAGGKYKEFWEIQAGLYALN